MITRLDISSIVFEKKTLEEAIADYEMYYKKLGYVMKRESIYKDFDIKIQLNEGDRVSLEETGIAIITWKCYHVEENVLEYALEQE